MVYKHLLPWSSAVIAIRWSQTHWYQELESIRSSGSGNRKTLKCMYPERILHVRKSWHTQRYWWRWATNSTIVHLCVTLQTKQCQIVSTKHSESNVMKSIGLILWRILRFNDLIQLISVRPIATHHPSTNAHGLISYWIQHNIHHQTWYIQIDY